MTAAKHNNPPASASVAVEQALAAATAPMSVDEICQKVYGRIGKRERNVIHQNIARLDARGRIRKHAMTFELLPES